MNTSQTDASRPLEQAEESLLTAAKAIAECDPRENPVVANLDKQHRIGAHTVLANRRLPKSSKLALDIAGTVLYFFNAIPVIWAVYSKDLKESVALWELLAIFTTGLVCITVYVLDLVSLYEADKRRKHPRPLVTVLLQGSAIVALLVASGAGVISLWHSNAAHLAATGLPDKGMSLGGAQDGTNLYLVYLGCVAACGLIFCFIDTLIGQHSWDFEESEEAAISQTFASFPSFISFVLLAVVGVIFVWVQKSATPDVRLFFGGAAAFQMLISNITFLAIKRRRLFHCIEKYSHNVYYTGN